MRVEDSSPGVEVEDISRVGLPTRRTSQQQRHLTVRHRLSFYFNESLKVKSNKINSIVYDRK